MLSLRAHSGTYTFDVKEAQTLGADGKCHFVVTYPDAVIQAAAYVTTTNGTPAITMVSSLSGLATISKKHMIKPDRHRPLQPHDMLDVLLTAAPTCDPCEALPYVLARKWYTHSCLVILSLMAHEDVAMSAYHMSMYDCCVL